MIVKENLEISGRAFVKQYSDNGFYIERDGEKYSEAIQPKPTYPSRLRLQPKPSRKRRRLII